MKYLPYYIPFFGPFLPWIEGNWTDFDFKNPHFNGSALIHGIIWGIIVAG